MRSRRLLRRGSWPEASRIAAALRQETVGGVLLLLAAVTALICANLGDWYASLRDTVVGPAALHLDLTVGQWASDGLLAVFFFVAGLELKREFVAGDLRDPARAALPVVAAVGGMIVPAVLFTVINAGGHTEGWAIPTATDIAFALAVLAVISTHLPSALRTFLLTLAVVDDLLAITIIAIFYTESLDLWFLAAALVPWVLFAVLVRSGRTPWWILLPLALAAWGLVHASGVHATVAGVMLGFTVPVLQRGAGTPGGLADRFEHLLRPLSAGVAVPVFAFFAAGVAIDGLDGFVDSLTEPVALGIVIGLFAGKTLGVLGATWLMATFTRAELDDDLAWIDLLGLSMLAGVGFTVSLLIGELAFGVGSGTDDLVRTGVLTGSVVSAAAAAVVLRLRNRHYRLVAERERVDLDGDGVPDVYQVDER